MKKFLILLLATVGLTASAQTNANTAATNAPPATNAPAPAIPALSGVAGVILSNLVDLAPYVSNRVALDVVGLYNPSNPKGLGKVGEFGDITIPLTKQSAAGFGGGDMAHRAFVTPFTLSLGTTLTNLPSALGHVYTFVAAGPLYDFSGKEFGAWSSAGFYKAWTINPTTTIGLKLGTYDDSVIPGVGWFVGLTGTF